VRSESQRVGPDEQRATDDARRRVLVCTPFPPRLDARHGGKATAQLLLRLAERHDIGLLCLRGDGDDPVDPVIADRCEYVEEVPHTPVGRMPRRLVWALGVLRGLPPWATDCRSADYAARLERVLGEWRPEIVEIHLQVMAQYVGAAERRNLPRILVEYDPGSAWAHELLTRTRGPRRLLRHVEVAAWRRYERATRPSFDTIVVFAERDVAAVQPTAGGALILKIAYAVDVPSRRLDPEGSGPPTVLFVGGFAHHPNIDAALWLARSIFPRILERVPGARLEIVGHEPGPEIRALAAGAVSVHASVPDVTPYLDRAAVVVAPIRIGGSMRMKVVEALALGKALVATPRAAEGVEAIPGEEFLLAADDDELVDAIAGLLLDRDRRRALGERARSWAETNLGWDRGVEDFERLYAELVDAT
jgi:polysaccharide biosynthesis protein PslH